MGNSAVFSREIMWQERSIVRQIMRFFKADLTLFFWVSGEETHSFTVQRAIRHKKTTKASKLNQLLPHFNYFNLKWLI